MKNFLNYIIVFIIFSGGLTAKEFFSFADFRVFYFIVPVVLLLWLPFLKSIRCDKSSLWFFSAFSILIFFSLINISLGNNDIILLLKQVLGISLSSFVFFLLFKINNYNVEKLFKVYLNFANTRIKFFIRF